MRAEIKAFHNFAELHSIETSLTKHLNGMRAMAFILQCIIFLCFEKCQSRDSFKTKA